MTSAIRVRCSTNSSYEATHWELGQFIEFISPIRRAILVNLQQKPLKLGRLLISSACNTPVAIRILVPMAIHSFPVPSNLSSTQQCFSAQKIFHKGMNLTCLYTCNLDDADQVSPEKPWINHLASLHIKKKQISLEIIDI